MRNVHLYTTEEFHAVWSSVRDFVLAETLDDGGRPQGHAILRITQAYQSDDDGAFAKATYYQYWVDHATRVKVGRDGIIHVLRWCTIGKQEGEALLRDWGLSPVLMSRKVRPVVPGEPSSEGAPQCPSLLRLGFYSHWPGQGHLW